MLVDAGATCRKLVQSLEAHGLSAEAVQGICITHTHTDHIKGLRVFLNQHPVPVYGTAETLAQLRVLDKFPQNADLREILPAETIHTDTAAVTAFATMHDSPAAAAIALNCQTGKPVPCALIWAV